MNINLVRILLGFVLLSGNYGLLAAQPSLPSPELVLGFQVGSDYHLATYEESLNYFRQLDAASDRMQLVEVGRTSEGRTWYFALISSAANLAAVERYREIADRLAHPADLTDETARALAAEGRAIVDVSGGLHASEVAGAQHLLVGLVPLPR